MHSCSPAPVSATMQPWPQDGCWSQLTRPTAQWPAASHFFWHVMEPAGGGDGEGADAQTMAVSESTPAPGDGNRAWHRDTHAPIGIR